MNMEKEQKEQLYEVRIPCNSGVKEYTIATLKRLGLDDKPGRVYNSIISGIGVTSEHNRDVSLTAKTLLEMIPKFRPPVSVPITEVESKEYDAFNEKWSEHIKSLMNDAFSIIYLRDEVNKVLTKRKSNIRCERKHLVWCLSLFGESAMTPEGVANAISKYNSFKWETLQPLKNDTTYNVRLKDHSNEGKQKFLDTIEFIYALSLDDATYISLKEKLQNDINVLKDCAKWGKNLTDYKYIDRYTEFAGKLQTLPATLKKKFKDAKKQIKVATPEKQDMPQEEEQCATVTEKVEVIESSSNESTEHPSANEQTTDSNEQDLPDGIYEENDDMSQQSSVEAYTDDPTSELTDAQIYSMNMEFMNRFIDEKVKDKYGKDLVEKTKKDIEYICHSNKFGEIMESIENSYYYTKPDHPGGWLAAAIKRQADALRAVVNPEQ